MFGPPRRRRGESPPIRGKQINPPKGGEGMNPLRGGRGYTPQRCALPMGETTPQMSDERLITPLMRDYTPNVYLTQVYTTLAGGDTPQTCDIQMLYPPKGTT